MKTLSYLDNLVARQLPETAVIQPRPVSLFEPWPGATPLFPASVTGEEATAVSSPDMHPLPRPQTSPTPAPARQTAPEPAAPTPIPVAPAAAALPRPFPMPTLKPASSEPAQPPQNQPPVNDAPAATPPAPPRQPAPTPATPVIVASAPSHNQAEPEPARETHPSVIIREQITLLRHVAESPAPPAPALVEIVREQPIQPLPPVAAAPVGVPEPASQPTTDPAAIRPEQIKPFIPANGRAPHHPPPVTPPEPAPTVHITIGRIEVRATPPPPAKAAQKQPRTPVLSLDDYLRQRNGGRP
ncbi:MAG: hypothetical protein KF770_16105 [Anaerolineae bacterium]|nr:hypothetical protein [Anaerolineae bacterium]